MTTLAKLQAQVKTGFSRIPDYLASPGVFRYTVAGVDYNPENNDYSGVVTDIDVLTVRGTSLVEDINRVTFTIQVIDFAGVNPTVNDLLIVEGETWNISNVFRDPIGLVYVFTVENKDGV